MATAHKLSYTLAQINPTVGNIEGNLDLIDSIWREHDGTTSLIIFPELSITGYMPYDLLFNNGLIDASAKALEQLALFSKTRKSAILVGAPLQGKSGLFNAAFLIAEGKIIASTRKYELPNYGVFDEKRYFTAGNLPDPINYKGVKLGIMLCEDVWFPTVPDHLASRGAEIFIVMNGSPFEIHKQGLRLQHAGARAQSAGIPLIYVNQVGGHDDLIYDGDSFAVNENGDLIAECFEFREDIKHLDFRLAKPFEPEPNSETHDIYEALVLSLRDYMRKTGQNKILLGMSGGIDSALSAVIAADAIGPENIHAVMMPSHYTSEESLEDAADCAQKIGISYEVFPIMDLIDTYMAQHPETSGLAHENLQSRLRGVTLMTLSNQSGAMVLTTGNKSEMATGYATLYGDMCGGYNVLKDIYKTQVYSLAAWRNLNKPYIGHEDGASGEIINARIMTKAPTAELKPGQKDQDSLPPYEELDQILACLIEDDFTPEQIEGQGHDAATVARVMKLVKFSEFKRWQSAPGPKISRRAFARERRYPIVNGYK